MIYRALSFLKRRILFISDVFIDAFFYYKYSSLTSRNNDKYKNLRAQYLAKIHSIERAFSLRSIKKKWGETLVFGLNNIFMRLSKKNSSIYDEKIYKSAIGAYQSHHELPVSVSSTLRPYKLYKHVQITNLSAYSDTVNSRHSIRDFGGEILRMSNLLKAIASAKKNAPSVCNRQSCGVIIVENPKIVSQVLALQNGNAGIEGIQKVLIVFSDITSFFDSNERNQPYIDGGIFLMCLLNALHFKNIAACALNWSVNRGQDKKLKKIIKMGNDKIIISMVAIGSYPDQEIKVASSYKKALSEIISLIR